MLSCDDERMGLNLGEWRGEAAWATAARAREKEAQMATECLSEDSDDDEISVPESRMISLECEAR